MGATLRAHAKVERKSARVGLGRTKCRKARAKAKGVALIPGSVASGKKPRPGAS